MRWIAAVLLAGGILAACGSAPTPEPTPRPPLPTLQPSALADGRQVYTQYCQVCHGPSGEGTVKNWLEKDPNGNLPPPPHNDTGHTWRHGDGEITQIIQNGMRDPFNKSPDLTMPSFKGTLSNEQMAAVITYLKNLWSADHRRYQAEQSQKAPTAMEHATNK